jgi:anti-sigma regulatory factor (Ser/Thr protein kinase)
MNVYYPTAGHQRPLTATVVHGDGTQERDMTDTPLGSPVGTAEQARLDGRTFQLVAAFPADPAAVSRARRELHRLMCKSEMSSIADAVALGAQELMANAMKHGCQGQAARTFTVKATCRPGLLRVEVQDPSPKLPKLRPATDDHEGGRGLLLVEALAARWGVQGGSGPDPGKTVWMEMDVATEEAAS